MSSWFVGFNPFIGPGPDDVIIAVLGSTGSGKSSLIQRLTGNQSATIGHSLYSETAEITPYSISHGGTNYVLVDTPGFGDTLISDDVVTEKILNWLASSYRAGRRLNGILFLHPIDQPRMQGSSLENLRMFRQLVGPNALQNVVLVTTMWDRVPPHLGEYREAELLGNPEFWAKMYTQGSTTARIGWQTLVEECFNIIGTIASKNSKVTLQAQEEMVLQGKAANQTAAAMVSVEEAQRKMEALLLQQKLEYDEQLRQRRLQEQLQLDAQRRAQEAEFQRQQAIKREQEAQLARDRQAAVERQQQIERENQRREAELRRERERIERQRKEEAAREKRLQKERQEEARRQERERERQREQAREREREREEQRQQAAQYQNEVARRQMANGVVRDFLNAGWSSGGRSMSQLEDSVLGFFNAVDNFNNARRRW